MKLFNLSRQLIAMGILMAASLSCSDDDPDPVVVPSYDITVQKTSLGDVLADSEGRTLYFFSKDVAGASVCTGGCLTAWPVFSKTSPKLDPGLTSSDFGSITRPDNSTQVTYKGWPLYYYQKDTKAGDVLGEDVGKVWFVAKTTYSIMIANEQLVGNDGKSYTADLKEGTGATTFFTDDMGRTLYGFASDKKNKNNFTKADFSNDASWPIYTAELKDLPSTVDKKLFSTIDVFGKKQLTYKGWPLYYFGNDKQVRGATKGVSVPKPGIWPIVNLESPIAPE